MYLVYSLYVHRPIEIKERVAWNSLNQTRFTVYPYVSKRSLYLVFFLPSNQLPTLWVLKKNRAWQPKKMRLSHAHIPLARSIKFISITWNWRAVIISIVFNNEIRIEIDNNKYRLFIFQKVIFLIVMLRKRCLLKISGLYTFQYWTKAIIFLFILWLVSNK